MGIVISILMENLRQMPLCWAMALITWCGIIWLLTLYAWTQRRKKAQGNQTELTAQNVLYFGGPFLLILAIALSIVGIFVPAILVIAIIILLPFGLLIFGIVAFIDYLPDILQWIINHIGPLGEKILRFITHSPRLPLDKAARSAGTATTLLETFLARMPMLRTLTRHSSAWIFQVTGLNRQSILLSAASNNKIPLKRRQIGVTGLARLQDTQSLHRLACDPANHIEVRIQAVQALEALGDLNLAALAWHAIGRSQTDLVRRLDAAHNLTRLGHTKPAGQILCDYLSRVEGAHKFHILAARLLIETGGEQTNASRILKDYSTKTDPRLRLKAAAALCSLDQPAETHQPDSVAILQNIAADEQSSPSLRRVAVKALEHHACTASLIKLVEQTGLEHHLQRKVILALERLGKTGEASQAWKKIAQDIQAEPLLRVQAAEALGRLQTAKPAHELLMSLASEPAMQPQHLLEIARALLRLGFAEDSEVLLRQLADGLTSRDPVQRDAHQILRSIRSGHYEEWLKTNKRG